MCPEVNGIIIQHWTIIPRGIYQGIHEPITAVVNFDVFISKYAAVLIGMKNLG